ELFITDVDLSVDDTNKPSPRQLDFQFPILGQVTRGFDVMTQLMSTPVSNQAPVTPVIINTATIISNSQDTVLRLAASPIFVGNVTVTVTATNASHETATQSLQVKVIANIFNDPPFFGPIPPSIIVTQYTAASFQLMDTDVDGDALTVFPVTQ